MHPTGTTSPSRSLDMVLAGCTEECLSAAVRCRNGRGRLAQTGYPSAGAWHKGGAPLLDAVLWQLPFGLPSFLCAWMCRKGTGQQTRETTPQ